jgi:hypothetical protein
VLQSESRASFTVIVTVSMFGVFVGCPAAGRKELHVCAYEAIMSLSVLLSVARQLHG